MISESTADPSALVRLDGETGEQRAGLSLPHIVQFDVNGQAIAERELRPDFGTPPEWANRRASTQVGKQLGMSWVRVGEILFY